ncbi:MAG: hypothetical protein HY565_02380 [Candidatus Kerfeldbacteria bacterium]|nr:hypothetical protein [Candidatus Kerfeldbacteria bacterium]
MKRHVLSLLSSAVTLTLPLVTLADYTPQAVVFDPNSNVERNSGLGNATPGDVAAGVINWVLGLLSLIAISLVIYAGFLWLTARGNEEQVTKAKNILEGAIIGVLIILASYGATQYVFENLVNATVNGPEA